LGRKGGQRGRLEKWVRDGKHPTSKKELIKPRNMLLEPGAFKADEAQTPAAVQTDLLGTSTENNRVAAEPPQQMHMPPPWHLREEWEEEELQEGQEMDEPWEFDEGHSPG
jgi:hypothetical protein